MLSFTFLTTTAQAAVPTQSIAFHGQLTASGSVVSGSKSIIFQFYDASSGGSAVGSAISKTTTVTSGYFSVVFSASDLSSVDLNQALWIGVTVEGDVLSPRLSINSVPSSINTFGVFSYASAPAVGSAGALYYNTGDSKTYVSNGAAWIELGGSQWTTTGSDVYYNTGNVGIGTTTPGSKLVVAGQITTDGLVSLSTTATSTFAGPVTLASHCIAAETRFRRRKKDQDGEVEEVDLEALEIGDYVESFDETTQTVVFKKIENIFVMGIKSIIKIDTQKGYSIKTTEEHPYYVTIGEGEKGQWVKVKDISVGDGIAVIDSANRTVFFDIVTTISNLPEEEVYDLEIEGTHTFIANNIVAHNTYVQGGLGVGVLNTSAGTFALKQATTNAVILGDVSGNTRGSYALDLQTRRSVVNQIAFGACSTAVGNDNCASGCRSASLGWGNAATGISSLAAGSNNTASGIDSSAVGSGNSASANFSSAFGCNNYAIASCSTALGLRNQACGVNSTAVGSVIVASGACSVAVGNDNCASGGRSSVFGSQNTASGYRSSAFGSSIINSTANSVEIGASNTEKLQISSAGVNFVTAGAGGFCVNGVAMGGDVNNLCSIQVGYSNTAFGNSSSAVGFCNNAAAVYSSALGYFNTASGYYSTSVGHLNTASACCSSALGSCNMASASGSTAVGQRNTSSVMSSSAFGFGNTASGYYSSAIGFSNCTSCTGSTAVGYCNTVSNYSSSAFGSNITNPTACSVEIGASNTEKLQISSAGVNFVTAGAGGFCVNGVAVGGGSGDVNALSVVAVGCGNSSSGTYSSAFGISNSASGNCSSAFGYANTASGYRSSAFGSSINNPTACSVEIGASNTEKLQISSAGVNFVTAGAGGFCINGSLVGGCSNPNGLSLVAVGCGNTASAYYRSSAFGICNSASACFSTAVGSNITNSASYSVEIGASNTEKLQISSAGVNFVTAGAGGFCVNGVAVGGGDVNALSTIQVGCANTASGYRSSALGYMNCVTEGFSTASGYYNVVSGGSSVAVGNFNCSTSLSSLSVGLSNTASAQYSSSVGIQNLASNQGSVAFGYCNTASGYCSSAVGNTNTVSGGGASGFGYGNTVPGYRATASGYSNTASGQYSAAFGFSNQANCDSSLVFGKCLINDIAASTMVGQAGGWISLLANGEINTSSGASLTSGGTWTNASDRNLKENFVELDKEDILTKINSLPLTKWNYKTEDSSIMHIGPMAQDFYATFGLGGSDKSVSTIDPAGVALVGVQALSGKVDNLYVELGLLATSTDSNSNQGGIISWIKALGATVVDGVAHFVNVVVGKITASDLTIKNETDVHKTGYVIYDRATGAPLCVFFENGIQKTEPGECDDLPVPPQQNTGGTPAGDTSSTGDTSNASSTDSGGSGSDTPSPGGDIGGGVTDNQSDTGSTPAGDSAPTGSSGSDTPTVNDPDPTPEPTPAPAPELGPAPAPSTE